ncbi:MAG: hypothetical protein WKF75_05910 [Singulisphaera sp.]
MEGTRGPGLQPRWAGSPQRRTILRAGELKLWDRLGPGDPHVPGPSRSSPTSTTAPTVDKSPRSWGGISGEMIVWDADRRRGPGAPRPGDAARRRWLHRRPACRRGQPRSARADGGRLDREESHLRGTFRDRGDRPRADGRLASIGIDRTILLYPFRPATTHDPRPAANPWYS